MKYNLRIWSVNWLKGYRKKLVENSIRKSKATKKNKTEKYRNIVKDFDCIVKMRVLYVLLVKEYNYCMESTP